MMTCYSTNFMVAGKGPIPMDMLRYDGSYPSDQSNLPRMDTSCGTIRNQTIELTHIGPNKAWKPTIGRWASFGWLVVDVKPSIRIDG